MSALSKTCDLEQIAGVCKELRDIAMRYDVAIVAAEQRRSASNTLVFRVLKSRAPRPGAAVIKLNSKQGLQNYES